MVAVVVAVVVAVAVAVESRCARSAVDLERRHESSDRPRTIAILAILCGAEGWEDIQRFGLMEYLCSLPLGDARRIADATRRHWSVENTLHWSLDVTFREDESRIRRDHGLENFALMRRLALMLLRRAKRPGWSVKQTRKGAGWSQDELLRILQVTIQPQQQDIS